MNDINYINYINLEPDDRLKIFIDTLSLTNRTPEYFVNWEKVSRNTKKYELELHTLNYLIGKENIYNLCLDLFVKQPNLIKAIPRLIATRDLNLNILRVSNDDISFYTLDFNNVDETRIEDYVKFCDECGLLNFLSSEANKSLVDYVYGVEVGLDSNGRKNRSGTTMESIVQSFVENICYGKNIEFIIQASPLAIYNRWNIKVPVDKSERRFDFAIFNYDTNKLFLIETNYYGGGGSKLKSVSGEFVTLKSFIDTSEDDIEFIWVTDGQGWKTAKRPLNEAFEKIDNIFNLDMLTRDYLKYVISN